MKKQLKITLTVVGITLFALTNISAQDMTSPTTMNQEIQAIDIIYMRTGTILKGHILKWDSDGMITFKSLTGFETTFSQAVIVKVRQKIISGSNPAKLYAFKEQGFYQTTELGLSGETGAGISGTYSAGHMFNRWIGVGGGSGLESFQLGEGRNFIPVFAEARGYILAKRVTPYYAVRVGYGFSFLGTNSNDTDTKGGYLFNPQIGVRFGGAGKASYYMGVGAHLQEATYIRDWPQSETTITDRYLFKRTELKFGLVF